MSSESINMILKKRPYHHIDDHVREELVNQIIKQYGKMDVTIRQIAENLNINYSTAKTILSTFRKEGRVQKKKSKVRHYKKCIKPDSSVSDMLCFFDFSRYNKDVLHSYAKRLMNSNPY